MSVLDWTEILVIVAAIAAIVLINWYFLLGDRAASGPRDGSAGRARVPGTAGRGGGEGGEG